MKKFVVRLVLGIVLFFTFFFYLTSSEHPLGVARLLALIIIGLGWPLALIETALAASGAFHELYMSCRRRQWHREIRWEVKNPRKRGITTALL